MTQQAYVAGANVDALYAGRGVDQDILRIRGHQGVPATVTSLVSLGAPAAADDNLLVDAATSTELPDEAGSVVIAASDHGTSPVDNGSLGAPMTLVLPSGESATVCKLDVPRNLTTKVTHDTAIVAMTVTHSGYDEYDQFLTETHSITATGTSKTVTGAKTFAYWESTTVTVAADATANTLSIGPGGVLGLPFRLEKKGHCLGASIGGVQELINVASNATVVAADATTPSATTGDVRGTIAFNGSLNGTSEALVHAYFSGRNSQLGLTGKVQA